MAAQAKMDPEMFSMVLETLNKLEREKLTLEVKLEMDRTGEFPMELIQFMLGPEIALHLIFIPEEYGGLGAGAAEIAVISEKMAKMDMGVATSFLAICLGMDPIRVGATDEQKEKLSSWFDEQGKKLDKENKIRTGIETGNLLDVKIITDSDITKRTSWAIHIISPYVSVKKIQLKKQEN